MSTETKFTKGQDKLVLVRASVGKSDKQLAFILNHYPTLLAACEAAVTVLEEPTSSDTRELSFKLVDVAQLLTQLRSALEQAKGKG